MVEHIGPKPQYLQFQIILEHDGLQRVTDVPLAGLDIARVALEAEAQNLGMTQFLTQTVTTAIKKDMIEKILREPSPDPAPQAGRKARNRVGAPGPTVAGPAPDMAADPRARQQRDDLARRPIAER